MSTGTAIKSKQLLRFATSLEYFEQKPRSSVIESAPRETLLATIIKSVPAQAAVATPADWPGQDSW